ncbi:SGNH/GDSL hydrolase family protein [Spirillospora sp. CA-294931]|uniref:SGNH/GDSL hydrolase family protein n=1 Tax=Spirillospora sp. CA-294931 TaxID=3240042 RepID=UPI003D8AD861
MPENSRAAVRRKNLLRRLTVTVSVAACTVGLSSVPAQAAGGRYVALGDSYVAGAFTGPVVGEPKLCLRSSANYPSLTAEALGIETLKDASCSSAETTHMTRPQPMPLGLGSAPPQFDALTADTTLVTLGIGGNDVKVLDMITTCGLLSATDLNGAPCTRYFTSGGTDQMRQRIDAVAPKVAAVLRGIRERAPKAKVLVVGYLMAIPATEGCWPLLPFSRGDVPYGHGVLTAVNQMLDREARAAGATYVDVAAPGHDACQAPDVRWVEPVIPANPSTPAHPNAAGMRAVAERVVDAVNG